MSRLRSLKVSLFVWLVVSVVAGPAAAQDGEDDSPIEPRLKQEEEDDPDAAGGVVVSDNLVDEDDDEEAAGWTVEFFGYVRTQYTAIEDDPDIEAFGRNDGFAIADARVGFLGSLDNGLGFEIEIDGGVARPSEEANTAIGQVVTRLKDGYVFYAPHDLFRASAGQFKPPFDIEELISTADILFVERSVGSRGVQNIEGFNRDGLSVGRQVGVRVDSNPWFFLGDEAGPGVSYALAATNGQSANRALNDNDQAAFFGRLNLHWGDLVRLGGALYNNDRTIGDPPDQLGEERTGWTADLTFSGFGATLLASIIQVDITPAAEVAAEQDRTARSYQVQVAYEEPLFGLQPTYRFAYYDQATDVDDPANPAFEALTYHTAGLNYNAKTYPLRLMLNYTVTGEEQREIDNNRFDALVQVVW